MTRKPITDEDLFLGELKTALRALSEARKLADGAPDGTLVDKAWDVVSELEDKTRKLLRTLGYTEISAAAFASRLQAILDD